MTSHSITLLNEHFELLPQKAVYWEKEGALLLSDLHLGKATHFRKSGIAVPKAAGSDTLLILEELLVLYPVKKVYLLGDLFHSNYNHEWGYFLEFLSNFKNTSFHLIKGNHDLLKPAVYQATNLHVHEQFLQIGSIGLAHDPAFQSEAAFTFCGHIHPGYTISGKGRQKITLPCFHFTSKFAVLPAFGTFTGLMPILPKPDEEIHLIAETRVIPFVHLRT